MEEVKGISWMEGAGRDAAGTASAGQDAGAAGGGEKLEAVFAELEEFGRAARVAADRNFAGRIREAVDRERETVTNCNGLGNAAKLREAMESTIRFFKAVSEHPTSVHATSDVWSICEKALSAPPRNCDRFADEQDAQLAFLNEVWLISVDKGSMIEKDKFENWTEEMRRCFLAWLFGPTTEEGGDHAN